MKRLVSGRQDGTCQVHGSTFMKRLVSGRQDGTCQVAASSYAEMGRLRTCHRPPLTQPWFAQKCSKHVVTFPQCSSLKACSCDAGGLLPPSHLNFSLCVRCCGAGGQFEPSHLTSSLCALRRAGQHFCEEQLQGGRLFASAAGHRTQLRQIKRQGCSHGSAGGYGSKPPHQVH
eukprot:357881-Chlamydomonas_euryale.AAC.2